MCGISGCTGVKAAKELVLGLQFCLQHRGLEGSGIAIGRFKSRRLKSRHEDGLVANLIRSLGNNSFGDRAIGHNRYGTTGGTGYRNIQPIVRNISGEDVAIAHNGDLVALEQENGEMISIRKAKKNLGRQGAIFDSDTDTEVILHLLARSNQKSIPDKVMSVLNQLIGAYSLLILWRGYLIAAKDPWGFRPLVFGRYLGGYVLASETSAFDVMGVKLIRAIKPGEVIIISPDLKVFRRRLRRKVKPCPCSFEYVYLARPDSVVFNQSVSEVRENLGTVLAEELIAKGQLPQADLVTPVLDSGRNQALAFAKRTGIPMDFAINRNQFSLRTFIMPGQGSRGNQVHLKHNIDRRVVKGKRVIVVDDSLVRGTTMRRLVNKLKKAGAKEVHACITSPPITGACYYGIDTRKGKNLPIATTKSVPQIRRHIGSTSLHYISLEGFRRALGNGNCSFCMACFSGEYPILCN